MVTKIVTQKGLVNPDTVKITLSYNNGETQKTLEQFKDRLKSGYGVRLNVEILDSELSGLKNMQLTKVVHTVSELNKILNGNFRFIYESISKIYIQSTEKAHHNESLKMAHEEYTRNFPNKYSERVSELENELADLESQIDDLKKERAELEREKRVIDSILNKEVKNVG